MQAHRLTGLFSGALEAFTARGARGASTGCKSIEAGRDRGRWRGDRARGVDASTVHSIEGDAIGAPLSSGAAS